MDRDRRDVRRFEPEELADLMGCEQGELQAVAERQNRHPQQLYTRRAELVRAKRMRAANRSVFLPDTGLPYTALMARILRDAPKLTRR